MFIVFFVESYGKRANINGICVKNIVDVLTKQGHKVMIFTCLTEQRQSKHEIIDGVDVYRIERDIPSKMMNRMKMKKGKMFSMLTNSYMKVNAFLFYVILNKWPQRSIFTYKKYTKKAKAVLQRSSPDIVVGTYFHIDEVLATLRMKKYFPNAKTIVYMLDAMAGRKNPCFWKKFDTTRSIRKWEEYCLRKADMVFPMNAHKNHFAKMGYEDDLLEKIHYVDIPLLQTHEIQVNKKQQKHSSKLEVVYTGFSSRMTGSAEHFVHLLEKLPELEFHMYGRVSDEVKDTIESSKIYEKRVFMHGYVDNSLALEAQDNADFLVTFGSCSECMISGKIFEYMSRLKPIICFYQIDEDINLQYLQKYPNAICLREGKEYEEENIKKIKDFTDNNSSRMVNPRELEELFYYNRPEATAEMFLKLRKENIKR